MKHRQMYGLPVRCGNLLTPHDVRQGLRQMEIKLPLLVVPQALQ